MSLFTVLIVLVVVGVILWLINNYIPMDRKIKSILNVVVVVVVIIWLLQAFGLLGSIQNMHIGK
jgi:preprotein translocase subunit SecE